MPELVLIIAGLLGLGFLATRLARLVGVPHSVFLVLVGVLGVVILRGLHLGVPAQFWESFPEVVLYILLPPLVFDSAYHLDFEELRRDGWAVGALATVGLVISCSAVAFGLHVLLGVPAEPALLFGALISATDPVAVVALFREVGAPRRLGTIVEGESLLNDGTAIVLFRVVPLVAGAAGAHALASGVVQFAAVAAGGVLVGLAFVAALSALLRFTSHSGSAQLGLTIASAYASFIVADRFVGVSGVISTMTVGLYLGSRARLELSGDALGSMRAVWEVLALSANTLVFLAVGLSADPATWRELGTALPLVIALVIAARFLSVEATLLPTNLLKLGERVSGAYRLVLSWSGLRGGLALALVLILPEGTPYKRLLLTLATAVVLFSLLVNAVTTRPLLHRLGLDRLGEDEQDFFAGSLNQVTTRAFGALAASSEGGSLPASLVRELEQRALARLDVAARSSASYGPFEIQQLLLAEQRYYDAQLEDGVLGQHAYVALQRLVRGRLRTYGAHGLAALSEFRFDVELPEPWFARWLGERDSLRQLAQTFEALLQLEMGLRRAAAEASPSAELDGISQAWLKSARAALEKFFASHPDLGAAVQARFVAATFFASTRHDLEEMRASAVITDAVHAKALERLSLAHQELLQLARRKLKPGSKG